MPVYNVTVDDSSPLFQYFGAWSDSTEGTNTALNRTTHSTTAVNASVFLPFQGTAVYVYGSKDTRHSQFVATVEGVSLPFDANSKDEESQALLVPWGVTPGAHHLELEANSNVTEASQGSVVFDIDFAIITTGDNNPSTLSHDTILDDSSSNFTFTSNFINCQNDLVNQYFKSTMHCTRSFGGYAVISFYGNAIAVYGATSANHGQYVVSMDNTHPQVLDGSAPAFRPRTLLFLQSGLKTAQHTLNITNYSQDFLDLDYAVVSIWDGFDSSTYRSGRVTQISDFTTTSSATASPHSVASSAVVSQLSGPSTSAVFQSTTRNTNAGAIAGGAVGGLLVLAAFGATVFLLVRRLRSEQAGYRAERGWQRPAAWNGRNKSVPATAYHAPLPRWHGQSQVATQ